MEQISDFIIITLRSLFLLSLLQRQTVDSITCQSKPGTNSVMGRSSSSVNSCYFRSSTRLTFSGAKDLCETQLGLHLVFFETEAEVNELKNAAFFNRAPFWMGLNKVEENWYWTHFASGLAKLVRYSDWGNIPSSNQQVVGDFTFDAPGRWYGLEDTSLYDAVCEGEGDWASILADFESLLSQGITTTVNQISTPHATTATPSIATATQSTSQNCEEDSPPGYVSTYYMKAHDLQWYGVELTKTSRSKLSCVGQCVATGGCCGVRYSPITGSCYLLSPDSINPATLDCPDHSCYMFVNG